MPTDALPADELQQLVEDGEEGDGTEIGDFIAVVYDRKWYIGEVVYRRRDVLVKFMSPAGPTTKFQWP